jgi:biopolymer transport protein ExbD
MSAWKLRHEGSPASIDGLSLPQILEGLQDGRWEPTDEVMGPNDKAWVAIENHPQFAEVAADLEPPPPRVYDDETRLDMNALIDVCLVLLIFFILTTTYAVLQKRLDAPNATTQQAGPVTITNDVVEQTMLVVRIAMENNQPVIRVEDKVVSPERLEAALTSAVSEKHKTKLLLDYTGDVPQRSVVEVLDAARGAGVEGVSLLVPEMR